MEWILSHRKIKGNKLADQVVKTMRYERQKIGG